MPSNEVKDQHKRWLEALSTTDNTMVCELARILFDISSLKTRLEAVLAGDRNLIEITRKKDSCLSLLTSLLTANGMRTLADLEGMPNDLVSMITQVPFLGRYLPHSMVASLVLVKEYLSLRRIHPSLPAIQDITRLQLDSYLSSWSSAKQKGLFPCYEKVAFDGNSESWPAFCIELTGILIKNGFREIFLCAKVSALAFPEHLFFHSM